MKPSTPFIRRGDLLAWLTGKAVGFSTCDVRKWINEGVIARHVFPGARQKKKKTGTRAYYAVGQVATALGIDNPLKPSAQNPPGI